MWVWVVQNILCVFLLPVLSVSQFMTNAPFVAAAIWQASSSAIPSAGFLIGPSRTRVNSTTFSPRMLIGES